MLLSTIKVDGGLISGVAGSKSDVTVFKGISYAAPPVGDLRWRAPQPVIPWDGVRKCDEFGCSSLQSMPPNPTDTFYQKEFYTKEISQSEDCLYLNIWTPAKDASEKLPVMMWIHGGAFCTGYGHEIEFDGEGFAAKGVILVTINYRLGVFGFMAHRELSAESENKVSGNYGILDQIAALRWIQNNIEKFGGDPSRITAFGQSAGAKSVEILMSSPLTDGLLSGVIMQSGGGIGAIDSSMTLEDAERIGSEICSKFNVGSIGELRTIPAEVLHKGVAGFRPRTVNVGMVLFIPVIDGFILPEDTANIITAGNHHNIPCIIGYNRSETEGFQTMIPGVTAFADKQAELGRVATYVYRFSRDLPGDEAGSFHSGELWYVFETLDRCWRPFSQCDYELSKIMSSNWANFARTGNPNGVGEPVWHGYTKESKFIMGFDA